ncbi:MAG: hypothetical protein IKJ25_02830 [Clostridia bacterium]|nr:hypothetical protein [Clostridia bacterium]
MRFDRARLEALAALPDDKLWAEVLKIADSFGYSLPRQTPPHSELQKMRDAVKSDRINVSEALRVVNQYKNK